MPCPFRPHSAAHFVAITRHQHKCAALWLCGAPPVRISFIRVPWNVPYVVHSMRTCSKSQDGIFRYQLGRRPSSVREIFVILVQCGKTFFKFLPNANNKAPSTVDIIRQRVQRLHARNSWNFTAKCVCAIYYRKWLMCQICNIFIVCYYYYYLFFVTRDQF